MGTAIDRGCSGSSFTLLFESSAFRTLKCDKGLLIFFYCIFLLYFILSHQVLCSNARHVCFAVDEAEHPHAVCSRGWSCVSGSAAEGRITSLSCTQLIYTIMLWTLNSSSGWTFKWTTFLFWNHGAVNLFILQVNLFYVLETRIGTSFAQYVFDCH